MATLSLNLSTSIFESSKMTEKNKLSGSEIIWEAIRKTPIARFGLAPVALETLVNPSKFKSEELFLVAKPPTERDEEGKVVKYNPPMVSSLVHDLDEALNVRRTVGGEARVERYVIVPLNNGSISIKPIVQ